MNIEQSLWRYFFRRNGVENSLIRRREKNEKKGGGGGGKLEESKKKRKEKKKKEKGIKGIKREKVKEERRSSARLLFVRLVLVPRPLARYLSRSSEGLKGGVQKRDEDKEKANLYSKREENCPPIRYQLSINGSTRKPKGTAPSSSLLPSRAPRSVI